MIRTVALPASWSTKIKDKEIQPMGVRIRAKGSTLVHSEMGITIGEKRTANSLKVADVAYTCEYLRRLGIKKDEHRVGSLGHRSSFPLQLGPLATAFRAVRVPSQLTYPIFTVCKIKPLRLVQEECGASPLKCDGKSVGSVAPCATQKYDILSSEVF